MVLSSKQKRSFHSIISGLRFAKFGNKLIRFMTLTTSDLCVMQKDYADGSINKDFQVLRKRILRYSPYRLYKEGYVSKRQLSKYYFPEERYKKFSFEYFKVETNEGNGVLHILYRGSYLPYNFVVDNWFDIHLSFNANIQLVNMSSLKDCAGYVVSQYVGSQGSSYVRSSQSWKWVFRGFKSLWYAMVRDYPDNCLKLWYNILRVRAGAYFYCQSYLSDFVS